MGLDSVVNGAINNSLKAHPTHRQGPSLRPTQGLVGSGQSTNGRMAHAEGPAGLWVALNADGGSQRHHRANVATHSTGPRHPPPGAAPNAAIAMRLELHPYSYGDQQVMRL